MESSGRTSYACGHVLEGMGHPSSSLSSFPFTLTQKGTVLFHRGLPVMIYCHSTDLKVLEAANHGLTPLKLQPFPFLCWWAGCLSYFAGVMESNIFETRVSFIYQARLELVILLLWAPEYLEHRLIQCLNRTSIVIKMIRDGVRGNSTLILKPHIFCVCLQVHREKFHQFFS